MGLADAAAYAPLVALRALLGGLPPQRSLSLGAAMGRLYVALGGPRTRDALSNLAIAFPERSEPERRRVRSESFAKIALIDRPRAVVRLTQALLSFGGSLR